jgi:hypothetical protein
MLGNSSNNFFGLENELLLLWLDIGRDFSGDVDLFCSFSFY